MTSVAVFALAIQPLYGMVAQIANAAPNGDQIVRASAINGWSSTSVSAGSTAFVQDATAPYGNGALELTTSTSDSSRAQRTKAIAPNAKLSDVSTLSYWTKYISGPAHAGASLQLTVNGLTGTSLSTTLVYEPYYNGTIDMSGSWQQWNLLSGGKFWSTESRGGLVKTAGGPADYTLSDVIALNPNAKITGLKINIGTYNPSWVVRADGVNLNGTVYDFEPAVPTSQLNGENFNTVSDPYKGISVGFSAKDFGTVSAASVTVERADGTTVTKTANQGVLDLISNSSTPSQITAPFVIQEGTFTEDSDIQYWAPAPAAWTDATAPVKATVTVTDQYGTKTTVLSLLNQGAPSWPMYTSLLPIGIPTLISPSNNTITNNRNFTMTWNTIPGSSVYEYRTSNSLASPSALGDIIYTDTSASSNYSILGGIVSRGNNQTPDNIYYWQVRAGDGGGNWSEWSQINKVTVDTVAPTSSNDLADIIRGSVEVHQTVADDVQAASGKLRIWKQKSDGTLDSTKFYASNNIVTVNSDNIATYNVDTTALFGDGKYTVKFTSRDAAGNESSQQKDFVVDNTKPVATVKAGATYTVGINGVYQKVSYSLYDAYKIDKVVINGVAKDLSNNSYSDVNFITKGVFGAVEGLNTMVVYDVAGNTSSYEFIIDTIAPQSPVHATPFDGVAQKSNDFWFEWNDVEGAVSYEMQNSQNPETSSNGSFAHVQWTGDYQQIQPTESKARSVGANGTWYWQVRAIDAAGNKSPWTTPWKVTIDQQAPVATSVTVTPNVAKQSDGPIALKVVINDQLSNIVNAKYTLYKDGETSPVADAYKNVALNGMYGALSGEFTQSIDVSTLTNGTYKIQLHFTDAAGNQGKRTVSFVINNSIAVMINPVGSTSAKPVVSGTAAWEIGGAAAGQVLSLQIKDSNDINVGSPLTTTIQNDGTWEVVVPTALINGTYSFVASAGSGNLVGQYELTPVVINVAATPGVITPGGGTNGGQGTGSPQVGNNTPQGNTVNNAIPISTLLPAASLFSAATPLLAPGTTQAPANTTDDNDDAVASVQGLSTASSNESDDTQGEVKAAEDTKVSWSLGDLMLTAISVIAGLMALLGVFRKRETDEVTHTALRAVVIIAAAGTAIAYVLTNDFAAPMAWFSMWSIAYAVAVIAQISIIANLKSSAE
ncbi:hypothetical protein I8H89_00165 [Candidatus Saccharibacteria bacterium]|nr:hypothetical protein [Candidatus Saccharibacteria bacterium]